jgi:hypothetical protein
MKTEDVVEIIDTLTEYGGLRCRVLEVDSLSGSYIFGEPMILVEPLEERPDGYGYRSFYWFPSKVRVV